MKHKLLILTLLASTTIFAQSIPNGAFENWNVLTWQDPQYYMTSNGNNNSGSIFSHNAVKTTNAYHGNYAIQLTTVKIAQDTVAGYVINGQPQGHPTITSLSGGIPYNQKATGISLHYKYTIKTKDSALILVWFKLKGNVIGQYIFDISDTTYKYKLFTGAFSPALTLTPDSVVFGAATSSNILANGNGRLGSSFTIDSVNFTGVTSQPAELNGDFENWVNDTIISPQLWEDSYNNGGIYRTTDASSGKYALELITHGPGQHNNQVQPGQVDDGKNITISSNHDTTIGGYPYNLTTDNLVFDYKYAPADTADRAFVGLTFKKNSKIIWSQAWNLKAAASYTHMNLPFLIGTTPDSVLVSLSSSSLMVFDTAMGQEVTPTACVGADFKIDNFTFASQPLSVLSIQEQASGMKIYPNPVSQTLCIDFNSLERPTGATLMVMDVLGNIVMQVQPDFNQGTILLNVSDLTSGVYLIKVLNGNSATVAKFIKQ